VQHYRADNVYQAENVFTFNYSIKLMLLESVSILPKKSWTLFILPKVILHFYFWNFVIPLHPIQILHCKLTVNFVMVYWLLLTTNIKTPHNMHKTHIQNSRQWYGLWNTAASIRLSAVSTSHCAQCGNTGFRTSASLKCCIILSSELRPTINIS
jgi:hypothetical protein